MVADDVQFEELEHFLGHKRLWADSRWETVGVKFSKPGDIDDVWFMSEIRKSNEQGRCTEALAQACQYIMIHVFCLLKSAGTFSNHKTRCPKPMEMEAVWDHCTNRIARVHTWGSCWGKGQTNPVRVVFVTIQRHVRHAYWNMWQETVMRPSRKLGLYFASHQITRNDNAEETYRELTEHAD